MKLHKARVRDYRSIHDSGWFEVEGDKSILVGPNEAGKTAILQALHRLNPPTGGPGFESLRDYPRGKLNDLDTGRVRPQDVTVVEAEFVLDPEDDEVVTAIDPGFAGCTYCFGRRLDNQEWQRIDGGPNVQGLADFDKDLKRLAVHVDKQWKSGDQEDEQPSAQLNKILSNWPPQTQVTGDVADTVRQWLEDVALPQVDEGNQTEENRYDRLIASCRVGERRQEVMSALRARLPVFIYFNNYHRVRPLIHLQHLAERLERNIMDDEQYDFGNQCLLKLLGFTARELSDLGHAVEPKSGDDNALKAYRDQLDSRSYRLNAASVRLTSEIRQIWQPDAARGEADTLRVLADQQYLKVVVEDDLGVEVELDQRSEGFQWLVSFFVVFFAEAADAYEHAILLLDEPGLSLHGLKQREFRSSVSRLAERNQTIFTTHSPFLVGPDELDKVRVVEMPNRKSGTIVHTAITAKDSAALLPLQEALGYDMAQSLFAQRRNLILEGLTDNWYLEATAQLLKEKGLADLGEKIALVPSNSAGKVVYFATILHAHSLKVAALLDSDAAGDQAASQETLVHTLGNKAILRTKDVYRGSVKNPEIEDLLRDTLVSVAKEDPELEWDIESSAASQQTRPIIDIFSGEIGNQFSKYRLAKAYLRWTRNHTADDLTATERQQWVDLVEAVNRALR